MPLEGEEPSRRRVPTGRNGKLGPDARQIIGDLLGVAACGPFVPDGRSQVGQAGLAGRVGRGTGANQQVDVDHGQPVILDNQDFQAVGELAAMDRRQAETRGRRPGKRLAVGVLLGLGRHRHRRLADPFGQLLASLLRL